MNNKECHDPCCDHSTCQKEAGTLYDKVFDFCKKRVIVLPSAALTIFGFLHGSVPCLLAGLALLGIAYELDKIKTMIKNCGPWY